MPPMEASAPGSIARDAGLHGGGQVFGVDRQHLAHLRQVDRDAALQRQHVAFERSTGTVGNDGNAMFAAGLDDGGDFFSGVGEHHPIGQHRIVGRLIAAVMLAHRLRGRETISKQGLQGRQQRFGNGLAQFLRINDMVHCLSLCLLE